MGNRKRGEGKNREKGNTTTSSTPTTSARTGRAVSAPGSTSLAASSAAERAAATGLPVLVVDDPRARMGELAATVYGRPGCDLLQIGITGTSGKTTTAYLVEGGLKTVRRTGLIGTKPNQAAPRKRMLSSMTPTILAKDGKPVLITSVDMAGYVTARRYIG